MICNQYWYFDQIKKSLCASAAPDGVQEPYLHVNAQLFQFAIKSDLRQGSCMLWVTILLVADSCSSGTPQEQQRLRQGLGRL